MDVLVTGGAGYIGSHCCKLLAGAGHRPIALDDLSTGHEAAVRFGPLERGDLRDEPFLDGIFKRHDVEAVIHFAGSASVPESMEDPGRYFGNNVGGARVLLSAMVKHGVRDIVFSSTCAIYGVPERMPISENTPVQPVNPYGESKRMVERMLHWFGERHGVRWAALRYFNVVGADPEGELGEHHDPEPHLIPLALRAALSEGETLTINGNDYPTPDGTTIRDYVHVWDLCDAHRLALDYLREGNAFLQANVGTGTGHSIREVVETVAEVTGRPVPHRDGPRRPGDPPELVADPTRIRELLGWRPAHPELRTMVEHARRGIGLAAG